MPDYGNDLQFGTFITPIAQQPELPVVLAELTERAGLDQAARGEPWADRVEVEAFGRRHGRTLPGGTP